jgi:hypothetical protein
MKIKQFTQGITFFVTHSMYQDLKTISDQKKVALSELLRQVLAGYLETQGQGQEDR